ncbi:hypothetical protein BC831DRAFT_394315, partial [Entophlyctis helioformis]
LRAVVCEIVISERVAASVTDLPTDARKSDIMLAFLRLVVLLFGFRGLFSKAQQDDLVSALQQSLNRAVYAKACIQALTLALSEMPQSVTKHLSAILFRMTQTTSQALATPNLVFLSALARHTDLYVNFTETDYKRVFGVAIQYIRFSSSGVSGDTVVSNYVTELAFHVMSLWFMSLRLSERRKFVPFIIHSLVATSATLAVASAITVATTTTAAAPTLMLNEHAELVLEMMAQNTLVDCWPKPSDATWSRVSSSQRPGASGQAKPAARTWLQGNALMTVLASNEPGWMELIVRRPTGIVVLSTRLENSTQKVNTIGQMDWLAQSLLVSPLAGVGRRDSVVAASPASAATAASGWPDTANRTRHDDQQRAIEPGFLPMQFFPYPSSRISAEALRPLPESDAIQRALSVLDRTPIIELHKIGVIYVAPGQSTEAAILANRAGSRAYTLFLYSLGRLFRLPGCGDVYTGGLDTSDDALDGEYALCSADDQRLAQVIFHVTTLMPSREHDPSCTAKKRHIGNDFVTVVWLEPGGHYDQDTIPGQFNFFAVVVEP